MTRKMPCLPVGLLVLLLSFLFVDSGESQDVLHPNITFGDIDEVVMFEGQNVPVNVTVLSYGGMTFRSIISFLAGNRYTFEVLNGSSIINYVVPSDEHFMRSYTVIVRGKRIGISQLRAMVSAVGSNESTEVARLVIKVNVGNSAIQSVLTYVFYVPVMSSFLLMGMTMDVHAIAACFRRPCAIFIGFFCQFFLMPALSFGLAKLLRLEAIYALGLLLIGCSPGGKISNDLTVLLNADYVLSVTMTACSTTLALAMIPINVLVYTPLLVDGNITTPFVQIVLQIVILVSPILCGILLSHKWPRVKERALKILKPFVAIVMLIGICIALPFIWYIFLAPVKVYVAATLLPLCGSLVGAGIAKVVRLDNRQIVAIALETGVQNGLFAALILKVVYPSPEADLARSSPALCMLSTGLMGIALVIIKALLDLIRRNKGNADGVETETAGVITDFAEICRPDTDRNNDNMATTVPATISQICSSDDVPLHLKSKV